MSDKIERTFTVGAGAALRLNNPSGAVSILGGTEGQIQVQAAKQGSDEDRANTEIIFQQDRDRLHVETRSHGHRGCSVRYEVRVPVRCDVEARTASGAMHAENLNGTITLESASGAITGMEIEGQTQLHAASGYINVERLSGTLEVHNASGNVVVRNSRVRSFVAHSASGDVEIHSPLSPGGTYTAHLASGSFRLFVPATTGAHVSLHTASGRAQSSLPNTIARVERGHWAGDIGDGGAQIEAHTASGSLSIEPEGEAVNSVLQTESTWTAASVYSSTTAVLEALQRGELTLDDAMTRLAAMEQP